MVYIAGNWCFTKINQTTNSKLYQGKRTCIDNPFCFVFRRELTICRNHKRIRGTYLQKKKKKKKTKERKNEVRDIKMDVGRMPINKNDLVGFQQGQSYLIGRMFLFSLVWPPFYQCCHNKNTLWSRCFIT